MCINSLPPVASSCGKIFSKQFHIQPCQGLCEKKIKRVEPFVLVSLQGNIAHPVAMLWRRLLAVSPCFLYLLPFFTFIFPLNDFTTNECLECPVIAGAAPDAQKGDVLVGGITVILEVKRLFNPLLKLT